MSFLIQIAWLSTPAVTDLTDKQTLRKFPYAALPSPKQLLKPTKLSSLKVRPLHLLGSKPRAVAKPNGYTAEYIMTLIRQGGGMSAVQGILLRKRVAEYLARLE